MIFGNIFECIRIYNWTSPINMRTAVLVLNVLSLVLMLLALFILGLCLIRYLYFKYGNGQMSAEEEKCWKEHNAKKVRDI